jgi:lipopolysaccharide biosynthesis protein
MIYVHWDARACIRSDEIEQLRCYRRHADLAFVTACPALAVCEHALRQLRQLCDVILIRENEGYDFGSWKAGTRYCWNTIQQTPRLILVNDSCYGPITSLDELFRRLEQSDADAVGLTEATTIRPHFQSFLSPVEGAL